MPFVWRTCLRTETLKWVLWGWPGPVISKMLAVCVRKME